MAGLRRFAAIAAAFALFLTGCTYSYTINGETHDNSGFRLPDTDDLLPVIDDGGQDQGYSPNYETGEIYDVYYTSDGIFTVDAAQNSDAVYLGSENGTLVFSLDGSEDIAQTRCFLTVRTLNDPYSDIFGEKYRFTDVTTKDYRINGRSAVVTTCGTDEPLKEDGELELFEEVTIDYDGSLITVTSYAASLNSREDFFKQRILIKDIISSIRYMDEK